MTIDVRMKHPSYRASEPSIQAARDAYMGERAVKSRGVTYLPALTGQNNREYNAYKLRATFYSIVARTVAALTGLALTGDIIQRGNQETLDQMVDSAHGLQLHESAMFVVVELLLQGRTGIFLDSPAEARTVGLYGYVSDAIINWETNGIGEYTMVVLEEEVSTADSSNRFKKDLVKQYRVLELLDGVYTVMLYDKDSQQIGTPITPRFRGQTIDYIPFWTAVPDGLRAGLVKSPMEDIVNVNMSHYRTSADLEHGRHFCGLPTPIVSGADVGSRLRVGGSQAWVLPDANAKAYYLEFTGQGLESLENALTEKEAQLVSLSANIIDRSTRGSESPDTVRLRMTSETASLSTVVRTAESLLRLVYNKKSLLEGNAADITIELPRSFVSGKLTADEVQKYSKVYLEGGITLDAYVAILRRGGALSADRSDEEEKTGLKQIADKKAQEAADALKAKTQPTTH